MESLIYSFAIFISAMGIHSILHRYLLRRGIVTFKSISIYFSGCVALFILWKLDQIQLPLSSFLLYVLLVLFLVPNYLGVILSGETPAVMILRAFSRKKTRTVVELTRLFTEKGLLWDRIDQLQTGGFVRKQKDRFIVTPKGRWIASIIYWYQIVFHRPAGG